ncbi:MAG: glycosyltransferase [Rhodospirillaceae bacterium]
MTFDSLLLLLAAASLFGWCWLMACRSAFWRADQRMGGEHSGDLAGVRDRTGPTVSIVVPARDEADVIARAVRSLLDQDYGAIAGIAVVDDQSTDGTAGAVPDDPRVRVLQGCPHPVGWTGKLWAVAQGIAAMPPADFVWLTDADIAHSPSELSALVAKAEDEELDLVSLMVKLRLETPWDRLLIPAFVFFFQKLYPFRRVNDPADRTAAAAGGSMLVRSTALARIGGIEAIRNELIDDCALATAIKGTGGRIHIALAETTHSLRAYGSLGAIWSMVARSAFHQLRYSPLLLAGTGAAMALLYLVPPVILLSLPLHGSYATAACAALSWIAMACAEAPTLYRYGLSPWRGFALPAAGLLYTLMTLDSARRHWAGHGGEWKGRAHAP